METFAFACLHSQGTESDTRKAWFAFDLGLPSELADRSRVYALAPQEITLVNPNSGTCPAFKTPRDAEITIGIYKRVPILWHENPEENLWGLSFMAMLHMANDAVLFQSTSDGDVLPLYEGKMVFHFDHRFGDYSQRQADRVDAVLPRVTAVQHNDPDFFVAPRYWVSRAEVDERLQRRGWGRGWLLGWRDIARSTDERTMICSLLARVAVGHTYPLILSASERLGCLYANLASFALDYVVRQKIAGTHLTYGYVTQFPVLAPNAYDDGSLRSFVESRVLELTYTTWDMEPFARDLGNDGPPFRWDEERRFLMRAELDALFFHLYGIPRYDVDYIMETFPIVKRKDIAAHGTYRTKDTILSIYDAMATAKAAGTSHQTLLSPSPGHGRRHCAR
jgi:hypothetical protein